MTAERRRRSIRLPAYDYALAGAYFVTICAYERQLLFERDDVAAILRETGWRFHAISRESTPTPSS